MRVQLQLVSRLLILVIVVSSVIQCNADDKHPRVESYQKQVQPLLKKYCYQCHNVDEMESGIRVDGFDGKLPDRSLALWKGIRRNLEEQTMPPEDEPQPNKAERKLLVDWINETLKYVRSRPQEKNGSVRRLTVAQYRNTLRDLLKLEDDLADVLPPDAVSKDGFLNNGQTLSLSPLLVEAYFSIAEKALDRCIVDVNQKPVVQNFRMELGKKINKKPLPEKLILGALSMLLANEDFTVTELTPRKPFDVNPYRMRTKYRFIEGYQGNATVRGWREYDSIYHSVFACMRGNPGYPKGLPYQTIPEGLLLPPAIPSAELFGVESTYGPKSNFKISLRELPDLGRFRVTVKAAKYNDALLLDRGAQAAAVTDEAIVVRGVNKPQSVNIPKAGVYQLDAYMLGEKIEHVAPDDSKIDEGLLARFDLNNTLTGRVGDQQFEGQFNGDAKFVDSPFGKAIAFNGQDQFVVVPDQDAIKVGEGEFTVAAWIRPTQLRQAGIVVKGAYAYTHGWVFDMPTNRGVIRLETANSESEANGTVESRPGVIRKDRWQHVAVIVRRGQNKTRLYVNGFEVGRGTINAADLDNSELDLHIGRIPNANLFKGEIDDVRIYRRAISMPELQALIEPGRKFAQPPPVDRGKVLTLSLGKRQFASPLRSPALLVARLPQGQLEITASYQGGSLDRIALTPLADESPVAEEFLRFEKRLPRVGVHVGLRRDCGSTLNQVGKIQVVDSTDFRDYIFEGAIANFPSPDVEKDNVNYLAGIREIGVRSEYTDGRDMPRLLIRSVEFEGPFYETWPPRTHQNIFVDSSHKDDSNVYAREIIRSFASRAFRRPVTKSEEENLYRVWQESFADSDDFQNSIKDTLLVVLTSPQFLFMIENSSSPKAEEIEAYELASKLSYFLWNAAPDDRLLGIAAAGSLHDSIDSELSRLIDNPQFDQFLQQFATQWLTLDKLAVVETDLKRFRNLTRDMKVHLQQEPVRFLEHLIRHNLPIRNLVSSEFIVANEVTASYYGLADQTEAGFKFVAIEHKNENLGGLLSQAGIMAGLSDGRESNPVKRGAWFARKIIAEPPDDPPPNVPDLEQETAHLSLRERLEKHRNQKGCVKCHEGIDPWGLPFEQIDAGGLLKGEKVDSRSTLPDKTEVADVNALKNYLIEKRIDQVAFSFMKHVATYAIGRSLTYNEIEFLKEEGIKLKADGYRTQELVRFVVKSPLFLEK